MSLKLYLATQNSGKIKELRELLSTIPEVELGEIDAIGGMPDVDETENTYLGNALLKAKALLEKVEEEAWVLADDSGLSVVALGGNPGVQSARYAGPNADGPQNVEKLLSELKDVSGKNRAAALVCTLVLLGPDSQQYHFEGKVEGMIAEAPRGNHGYGYDPVFVPKGHSETFAELGPEVKNEISHRSQALALLITHLQKEAGAI